MDVKAFFDPRTSTLTYVVWEPETGDAVVIDPVLDYDPVAGRIDSESADAVAAFIEAGGLNLRWVLETHAHADHLSGSQVLKERFGAGVAISEEITAVQRGFGDALNMADLARDGSQFDRLLRDGEVIEAGGLRVAVIATPGHTPACLTYRVGDAIFTGDAMFMPDFGTGRCDFPGGSAETLYDSVMNKLYALPDDTRVFVGHDYQPGGRALAYETTIGASREGNKQLRADTSRAQFVAWRAARDATLKLPRLLFQSLQVNIAAGALPTPEANGRRYLKLPINLF